MTDSPDQNSTEDFAGASENDSVEQVPAAAPDTEAERPGSEGSDAQNSNAHDSGSGSDDAMSEDELVDEWGEESFPGSDAPGHY
ncbi:hypothetical protein [Brevibacterium sp.]|uniref:hypothetical protein n=1 Tax=Brevibacterium sp. TaxID=1701 RepID=UPI00281168C7|nr:hypothetical protein [Brevibacterium sp.]